MKVALYSRTSTEDKGQDAEVQLRELRAYCERMNYSIYREFVDVGESGAKESRPAFNELISEANKRMFDGVLVWKLDRFSRSLKHLLNSLEFLKAKNIDFICYNQNLDTTTPEGKLLFHIIGAFGEFERSLIAARVKAGLAKRRAEGKGLGRKNLMSSEMRSQLEQEILKQRKEGRSFRQIEALYRTKTGKSRRASLGFVHMTIKKFNEGNQLIKQGSEETSQVNG